MMSLQCCLHFGMHGKSKHSIRASFETGVIYGRKKLGERSERGNFSKIFALLLQKNGLITLLLAKYALFTNSIKNLLISFNTDLFAKIWHGEWRICRSQCCAPQSFVQEKTFKIWNAWIAWKVMCIIIYKNYLLTRSVPQLCTFWKKKLKSFALLMVISKYDIYLIFWWQIGGRPR